MKYLYIIILVLSSLYTQAQAPQSMSYQAVARDSIGICLSSQSINLQVSILADSITGMALYIERHTNVTTSAAGHFQISVGTGAVQAGGAVMDLQDINWGMGTRFLKIELAPGATFNFTPVGVSQLLSVPYSFFANNGKLKTAFNADSILFEDPNGNENVTIGPNTGVSHSHGKIAIKDPSSFTKVSLNVDGNLVGTATFSGQDSSENVVIGSNTGVSHAHGRIDLKDNNSSTKISLNVDGNKVGTAFFLGESGNGMAEIGTPSTHTNQGNIWMYDNGVSNLRARWGIEQTNGAGTGQLFGTNGNVTLYFGSPSTHANQGNVWTYNDGNLRGRWGIDQTNGRGVGRLYDSNGLLVDMGAGTLPLGHGGIWVYKSQNAGPDTIKGQLAVRANSNAGELLLFGSNNNQIVYAGPNLGVSNAHGCVEVKDAAGIKQASMSVDGNGNGVLAADMKPFFMDHPKQPGKEIWYCAIEGPEAAAYERGSSTLKNGETEITFSDHFQIVANHKTMTITLTPRSAESKGLAVIERTATGFKVKELFQGTGDYQFDWRVDAKRKGFEDFQVIRDKRN